jgi:hypothetical protein
VLVILEAMKMETEIKAARSGVVASVSVKEGDAVTVGQGKGARFNAHFIKYMQNPITLGDTCPWNIG